MTGGAWQTGVVVVGAGGSGLAAALAAAEAGCSVIVVEKGERPGGTTAISVGSISVNRTAFQRAQGIEDSPDAHFEDMAKFAGPLDATDNHALRRLYVERIAETFDWLQNLGVVFDGPFAEPPHRVPRMHLVMPNSAAYVKRLLRAIARHDIRILTRTALEDLLVENGRVAGVAVRGADPQAGGRDEICADRGVILATGDFSANAAMLRRFIASSRIEALPINPAATGDGQLVAERHGARILNGDVVWGPELRFARSALANWAETIPDWPWFVKLARLAFRYMPRPVSRHIMAKFLTSHLGPSAALFAGGAALVDETGALVSKRDPESLGMRGAGAPFWVVLDAPIARAFDAWPNFVSTAPGIAYAYLSDYLRMRPDVTRRAATLAGLAGQTTWDAARVEEALRHSTGRNPKPPFFALGPMSCKIPFTDGGLAVSQRMEVLDQQDRPIPGLYAAGSTGQGGLILNGHGHHIGWAFLSGRIAGQSVAAN